MYSEMLAEIREIQNEIRKVTDEKKKKEGMEELAKAARLLMILVKVVRGDGLLALEDEAERRKGGFWGDIIYRMVEIVCDGTNAAETEALFMVKYYSLGLTGFDALKYIVLGEGVLRIQSGAIPYVYDLLFDALLPPEALEIYKRILYEPDEEGIILKQKEKEYSTKDLEKLYAGGIIAPAESNEYYLYAVTDYALYSLDNYGMRRLMREVSNCDLSVALKGLSGKTRKNVLTNLPATQALIIGEEMERIGPVRVIDITKTVEKIFLLLVKLISNGEILCADSDAVLFFEKAFEAEKTEEVMEKKRKSNRAIYDILRKYESRDFEVTDGSWKET